MSSGPILVFGASGFLGRTLIAAAAAAGRNAVGLSRGECDITDAAAVDRALDRIRPRLIVNAAAFAGVDAAEDDRAGAEAVNATGPEILGAKAAVLAVPVVHVSSDYVFDGRQRRPYTEDDPVAPLGHYGHTKAAGEARLRAAQPRHIILRTAWLFGEHGGGFVRMAIDAALRCQPVRTIVEQTGSPTDATDLARAILAVDTRIGADFRSWGTYHYAGHDPASRLDMVAAIFDAVRELGRPVPQIVPLSLESFAGAAPRPQSSALDSSRFIRTFDFPASDWRRHLVALVHREAAAITEHPIA